MPVREAFFPTQRRPRTYTTVKTRNVSSVYLVRELLDSLPLPLPHFSVFAPSPTALFFYLLLPWSTVRQIWKLKVSERCCFVLRSLSRLRWKKVPFFFNYIFFLINCNPCFFFFSSFALAPSHFRLFFFFFSHSLVSLSFFFLCVCARFYNVLCFFSVPGHSPLRGLACELSEGWLFFYEWNSAEKRVETTRRQRRQG